MGWGKFCRSFRISSLEKDTKLANDYVTARLPSSELASKVANLTARQFLEVRNRIQEDAELRNKNLVMAAVATFSILVWLCELGRVTHITPVTNPNMCDGDQLLILKSTLQRYDEVTFVCQGLYTFSTVVLVILVYRLYRFNRAVKHRRSNDSRTVPKGVLKSGDRWKFLFEIFLCILQPIPFINMNRDDDFLEIEGDPATRLVWLLDPIGFRRSQVNMGLLLFVRCYLLVRLVRDNTVVYRARRQIAAYRDAHGLTPIRFNWGYALRSVYHRHPLQFTVVVSLLILAFFSIAMYVAEWNQSHQVRCFDGHPRIFNIYDSIYLSIITLTSVGYGDFTPRTPLGQLLAMLNATTGVVLNAIVVTTFMRSLELSRPEVGGVAFVTSQKFTKTERQAAALVIQQYWKARCYALRGKKKDFAFAGALTNGRRQASLQNLPLPPSTASSSSAKALVLDQSYVFCAQAAFRKMQNIQWNHQIEQSFIDKLKGVQGEMPRTHAARLEKMMAHEDSGQNFKLEAGSHTPRSPVRVAASPAYGAWASHTPAVRQTMDRLHALGLTKTKVSWDVLDIPKGLSRTNSLRSARSRSPPTVSRSPHSPWADPQQKEVVSLVQDMLGKMTEQQVRLERCCALQEQLQQLVVQQGDLLAAQQQRAGALDATVQNMDKNIQLLLARSQAPPPPAPTGKPKGNRKRQWLWMREEIGEPSTVTANGQCATPFSDLFASPQPSARVSQAKPPNDLAPEPSPEIVAALLYPPRRHAQPALNDDSQGQTQPVHCPTRSALSELDSSIEHQGWLLSEHNPLPKTPPHASAPLGLPLFSSAGSDAHKQRPAGRGWKW